MATVVDKLYGEFQSIAKIMERSDEVSFRSTLDDNFRKALLLCAASHFEYRITSDVLEFCKEMVGADTLIPSLVKNKAVSRQYHTWFSWDKSNANAFFSMSGDEFRAHMSSLVSRDEALDRSIVSFLELGRERNRLVHQDYGSFFLEKTADEIFALYVSALSLYPSGEHRRDRGPAIGADQAATARRAACQFHGRRSAILFAG
jgi:HEPN superfamily RiboL-PSP-like protein